MQGLEHKPTRETRATVVTRKARGCSQAEIAESMDINVDTLYKHYEVELRIAKPEADDKVYSKLMQRIDAGSDKLIDLYARTQLGWRTADSKAQVDATIELAKATEHASQLDVLTNDLVGHLVRDANVVAESTSIIDNAQDVSAN